MRIIGGKHSGRNLAAPRGDAIRPTADRVRESVFFMLGDLTGIRVIDAYAGAGTLGCEAISRGAERVWFFDTSPHAIEVIRENVSRVSGEDAAVIVRRTFHYAIEQVDEDVDLVFVDPPWASGEAAEALETLATCEHVREDALVVIEHDARTDPPEHHSFELDETRTYGDTCVTFLYRR